jgi:hypothetical protein
MARPAASKKRLMELKKRLCMAITPLGSVHVPAGAARQVGRHEIAAAHVAASVTGGSADRPTGILEKALDHEENVVRHGDPPP